MNKLILDLNGKYLNYVYLVNAKVQRSIEIPINQDLSNYVVQSLRWLIFSEKINFDDHNVELIFVNGPGSFNNVRIGSLMTKMVKIFHPNLTIYETNKLALYACDAKKEVDFLSTSKNIYFVYIHDQQTVKKALSYCDVKDFEILKQIYNDYEFVDLTNQITSDYLKKNTRFLNFDHLKLIEQIENIQANYLKEPNIDLNVLNRL